MTSLDNTKSKNFIEKLKVDFPAYVFMLGSQDHWSPRRHTITYTFGKSFQQLQYCVLHELAHAELNHTNYTSDVELLKLEADTWELAAIIGKKYDVEITPEHIQHCLDTYRDWLHRRSACPGCGLRVLQSDSEHYACFNCHKTWAVTPDRFTRAYRKQKTA